MSAKYMINLNLIFSLLFGNLAVLKFNVLKWKKYTTILMVS